MDIHRSLRRPSFCWIICGMAGLTTSQGFAATGDPLPGIDVLVRCKPAVGDPPPFWKGHGPNDMFVNFGGLELGEVGANALFPGSSPFAGLVEVTDLDSDAPGRLHMWEGATPDVVDVELVGLSLASVDPIEVVDGSGASRFFDLTADVTGVGQMVKGGPDTVVDSFLDLVYEIEFVEIGGGATHAMSAPAHLDLLNPFGFSQSHPDGGTSPFVPGFLGTETWFMGYASPGGDFGFGLFTIPSPSSAIPLALAWGMGGRRRRT